MSSPNAELRSRGSLREGLCLGLLLHLGIQALYAFAFVRALNLEPSAALALLLTLGGVTQLPYMVPAIVDAKILRKRDLTARGLGLVAMIVLGISLWCLAAARASASAACGL